MMQRSFLKSLVMPVCVLSLAASFAAAQQEDADYQAKLKAGREAAYKKFLLVAPVAPVAPVKAAPPPTGASLAVLPRQVVARESEQQTFGSTPIGNVSPPPSPYIYRHQTSAVYSGDLRDLFYNDLNVRRGGRYADYPIGPYVFQPLWDSRYRRSWPRPVVVREYVKSHWLFDGQRYTYVPGHAEYETRWITQGQPRYHWNGSHYSVTVSYR